MQRSISRRDFGKRLAGGAALLALQPAWNYPAAGQSLRNDLKDITGELSFDDAVLQAAADDFGRVVHKKPAAVLRPSDAQDIAKLVQFANRQGLRVAMRGQGHSFFGQTQVEDGVVIDEFGVDHDDVTRAADGNARTQGAKVLGRHRPGLGHEDDRLTRPPDRQRHEIGVTVGRRRGDPCVSGRGGEERERVGFALFGSTRRRHRRRLRFAGGGLPVKIPKPTDQDKDEYIGSPPPPATTRHRIASTPTTNRVT